MIPWSADLERELRQRILLWRVYALFALGLNVAFVVLFLIYRHWFIAATAALFFCFFLLRLFKLSQAVNELGYEETAVPGGRRWPGSGMLANKPRDISQLTKWREWKDSEGLGPLGFTCENCSRPHDWKDMQWIPNIPEDVEEVEHLVEQVHAIYSGEGSGPIDPGGGRYVLICQCGMGHFRLKEVSAQRGSTAGAAEHMRGKVGG